MQGNILKEEFKNEVGEWYQTHDSGNCFYRPTQVAYQDLQVGGGLQKCWQSRKTMMILNCLFLR